MKLLMMIVLALLLTGCSQQTDIPTNDAEPSLPVQTVPTLQTEPTEPDPIDLLMESMTTEEKVGQMLLGYRTGIKLALTYYPTINEYMGRRTVQIVVQNYQ